MPSLLLVQPETSSPESTGHISRAVSHARLNGLDIEVITRSELSKKVDSNDVDAVMYVPAGVSLYRTAVTDFFEALNKDSDVSVVYSDGEKLALPDFSPQRLLCQNYLRGPVVFSVNSEILNNLASTEFGDVAAVYFTLLDIDFRGGCFEHISQPSYSFKSDSFLDLSEDEIVQCSEVLKRARAVRGGGTIGNYLGLGVFESHGSVVGDPLVSIVIPTQALYSDHQGTSQSLVVNAVKSIVGLTDYSNYELVVVVDSGADDHVLAELRKLGGPKLRIVEWTKPFNFSQKMNFGVLHAQGEYVLLLNDDVEVLTRQWLSSMLVLAQLPNAGMAGAMLYYEDDTIQHAGHAYFQGSPTHIGLGLPRGSHGPLGGYLVSREVSGVTAACALMPMKVFKEVGGFTALLPGNFNDVDLCLKVGWRGYDIYWTPEAELYHFESKTRDAHVHYYELDVIEHRWGLRLDDSRYWRGHPWSAN